MKEVKLASGAILKISNIPFATAKALYQSILEEAKAVKLDSQTDMAGLVKDLFCVGFSSKKIDSCLSECLKRCTYNDGKGDLKIDDSTFEPLSAREDYSIVCIEVIQETISPFTKGLYAEFGRVISMIESVQT